MGWLKKKSVKPKLERQRPIIESLEPRILMSADFPGLDLPDIDPDDPLNADVDQILARAEEAFLAAAAEADAANADEPQQHAAAPAPVDDPGTALSADDTPDDSRQELIIVDPSVPDYELLLADISAVGGDDTRLNVVMLDPHRNGIEQIGEILASRTGLGAIHLISHGGDGEIRLGTDVLDLAMLQRNEDSIQAWGDALSAGADILIYGCNLAATDAGEALVDALATATGADVAASDDLTGNAERGGDWDLEYRVGDIDTAVPFALPQFSHWQGTLDITSNLVGHYAFEENGGATLTDSSGNQDGTFGNVASWTADSAVGSYALDFGGDSAGSTSLVAVADNAAQDFGSGDWTVAFWYNLDGDPTGSVRFIGDYDDTGEQTGFLVYGSGSTIILNLEDGFSFSSSDRTGTFNGSWQHVALTFDSAANSVDWHLNGSAAGSMAWTGGSISTSDLLRIGGSSSSTGDYEGKIDDVRLYTRELSPTDVDDLVALGPAVSGPPSGYSDPSGSDNSNEWITNVTYAGINNTTGADTNAYGNYTAEVATVTRGDSNQLSVSMVEDNDNSMSAWIDWNQDGDFDDAGEEYIVASGENSPGPHTFDITTPGSAALGTTVMRVGMAFSGAPSADGGQTHGEWEDYSVTVSSAGAQTFTVINTDDSGAGSLRQAIIDANANSGADTIDFNIGTGDSGYTDPTPGSPGSGDEYWTIGLSSALPDITDTVTIDGTTQTGWVAGSFLPIVVDGNDLASTGMVLADAADGSTIRGLLLRDFSSEAISIAQGASGNTIAGNWIGQFNSDGSDAGVGEAIGGDGIFIDGDNNVIGGTNAADRNVVNERIYLYSASANNNAISGNYLGTDITGNAVLASGGAWHGVVATNGASNNTIGGATDAHRNIIVGESAGIDIEDSSTSQFTIQNNWIGLGADGSTVLGSGDYGIFLYTGDDHVIGGVGTGNVILGSGIGIAFVEGVDRTTVQGNYIGIDETGTIFSGNGTGISIQFDSINNTIGGVNASEGNVITGSTNAGISTDTRATTVGNTIRGNSIYDNDGLGIDLNNDGITANDAGDADTGANNLQNWAVLSSAAIADDGTFGYDIDTTTLAAGDYIIDFYASSDSDGGEVEGERYLGSLTGVGNGNGSLTGTLAGITLAPGEYVTLVTTDGSGNSSEFSNFAVATDSDVIDVNQTVPAAQSIDENTTLTFTSGTATEVSVTDTLGSTNSHMRVTLSVNDGVLNLSQTTGLTFIEGADNSGNLVIDGTESDINAALDGMTFTPDGNFTGSVTLNMATVLAADLDGHYTFETDASDQSAGTVQDGALNGNAAIENDAERGRVLSLDGDGDYVQINGLIGEPANVTLSAWINADSIDVFGGVVISMGISPALYLDTSGTLVGYYESGGTNNVVQSTESLVGTGWRHVAVSIDAANSMTIYIDGDPVKTTTPVGAIEYDNSPDSYIGRAGDGDGGFDFDGMIDEARIYSRALSADEIAALATDQTEATDSVAITVDPVNDAPVITELDGDTLSYDEGDGPVVVDQGTGATVTDVDSADFAGGNLTISSGTLGDNSEDQLSIRNQGTGAGEIGFDGTNVTYQNVLIGTASGGSNGADLVITLNASADKAAASALTQNVTYENSDTSNPTEDDRTISFTVNDGDGGTSVSNDVTISVNRVNDAPQNGLQAIQSVAEDGALVFSPGNGNAISVNDIDSGTSDIRVTLTVTNGVFNLAGTTGLTSVSGNGTTTVTIEGPNSAIYAALNGSSYVPTADYNGSATLTMATDDLGNTGIGGSQTDTDVMNITVTPDNDVPVNTVPGSQAVNENTALAISGISVNDVDGDLSTVQLAVANGTLNVTLSGAASVSAGANGTNTLTLSGTQTDINATLASLNYQGTLDYVGEDTLTVTSTDSNAAQDVDTVGITVNNVNASPVNTVPGAQTVDEDAPINISGITVNDADGDLSTVQLSVMQGTVTVTLSGAASISAGANSSNTLTLSGTQADINATLASLNYQGNLNYNGADALTILSTDSSSSTDSDTVTITVDPVDDGAVITGDTSFSGSEGDAVSGDLNATDVDGLTDGTYFSVTAAATNGTAAIDPASGAWTFTPTDPNWFGTDNFTVTVTDDEGGTTDQVVSITLANVDDGAVITGDTSFSGNEGDAVSGDLNATDVDGLTDGTYFTVSAAATNGTAAIDPASGAWTFTPTDPNWFGTDNFTVTVTDDEGGTTDQVVSITLANVDDGAVITGDTSFSGNEGDAVSGDLNATDVDGLIDGTYFTVSAAATNGTAAIDPTSGAWTFTPTDPNWFGTDNFTVTVTDDEGGTTDQLVSITLANVDDGAVITGDTSFSGNEGDAVSGDLNATDVDGLIDGTYFTVSAAATNGTAAIDPTSGAWTFTPTDPNWFGTDNFTVTVTDDEGGTTDQLVSITLANVDDGAVITGDTSFSGNEGDAVSGDLNATDVDGLTDGTYFSVTAAASNGTAAIDPASGAWTFTPTDPNWHGSDAFTVTVTDDLGGTTTQVVNITLANVNGGAVISGDISFSGSQGDAVFGDLDATDVDGLTDGTYFSVTSAASNGVAAIDPTSGTWTFIPIDPNWYGSDAFVVTVTDDLGGTTTQVVSITLTNVDDIPVIAGTSTGIVVEDQDPDADGLLETSGALSVSDPDPGESGFIAGTVAGSHGHLIINATGSWSYEADNTQASLQQLDAGESINDILTVTTLDGTSHNVTITIHGSEDAAVVSGDIAGSVDEDGVLVASGTLAISDVDSADNPVSFPDGASTAGDNGYGDFRLVGGSWSYTLNDTHAAVQALGAGDSLTDTHTFVASDGSTQVVTITIAGTDEAPVPKVEPTIPIPASEPVDPSIPPSVPEDPTDAPGDEISEAGTPATSRGADPSTGEPETPTGLSVSLLKPLQPDEIFLSVIADTRPDDAPGTREISAPLVKPNAESAQTFLHELKSFWKDESTQASLEFSDVRFNQEFWKGLDKVASDLGDSAEEQEKKMQLSAEAAAGVGISLTAGFVSWALRGGAMAASLLASMPAWRHFDPLPILGEDKVGKKAALSDAEDRDSDDDEMDTKVDELFDRR